MAKDTVLKRKRITDKKKYIFIILLLAWPVLHWLVFSLYLNIQTLFYSFERWHPYTGKQIFVGLSNYMTFLSDLFAGREGYATAVSNVFKWLFFNDFVLLPLSFLTACALSKKLPLTRLFRTIFFIPNLVSVVVLTMTWRFMWAPTGVVNGILDTIGLGSLSQNWLGSYTTAFPNILMYCLWAGIGWNCVVLGGAIARISPEILESARIDGITPMREIFSIILPSVWPTISTLLVIYTSGSFTVFLQSSLLTEGGYGTSTIALQLVKMVQGGDYGLASAMGIIIGILGFVVVGLLRFLMGKLDEKWGI